MEVARWDIENTRKTNEQRQMRNTEICESSVSQGLNLQLIDGNVKKLG